MAEEYIYYLKEIIEMMNAEVKCIRQFAVAINYAIANEEIVVIDKNMV